MLGGTKLPSTWSVVVFSTSIVLLSLTWWILVLSYNLRTTKFTQKTEEGKLKLKRMSWILTGITSFLMVIASTPFLFDYLRSGFDLAMILERNKLAESVVAVFLSYLVLDLCYGAIFYQAHVKLLTGWIHHSAYTVLLLFILGNGSCHVFATAAILELPTLLLSLGIIFPQIRNDYTFLSTFFVTRIVLHAILLIQFATPYGRLNGPRLLDSTGQLSESFVPLIGFILAAPLHIIWFYGSMKTLLKKKPKIEKLSSKPLLLNRPKFTTLASSLLKAPRPEFTRQRLLLKLTLEKEVKQFFDRSREWRESLGELLENGINVDDLLREVDSVGGEDSDGAGEVLKTMNRGREERMRRLGGRMTRRAREVLAM